ncbi:MAG: hypothetical protein Kow00114_01380 [Kiloniellaceae bacterium]
MTQTRAFWDSSPCGTLGDVEKRLTFLFRMEPWTRALMQKVASAHPHIVEIGCGQGTHAYFLCRHLPADGSYLGLDYSPASVDIARTILGDGAAGGVVPHFQVGDAENLPFADNSVPFIYSIGVLHHTADDRKAFQEAERVLCPGGRAVIGLYRHPSLKLAVAKLMRGVQKALDIVLRSDRCIYRFLKGRHFPDALGSMLLEGFGVPFLRAYWRRELPGLFPGLRLVDAQAVGYNLPHWNPKGSGKTPFGYLWVLELEKPAEQPGHPRAGKPVASQNPVA